MPDKHTLDIEEGSVANALRVLDLIKPADARLDRYPLKKTREPARGNRRK